MKRVLLALTLGCGMTSAYAGPADYVNVPAVEYGEKEIDFKYGNDSNKDDTRTDAASIGFGWGVTPTWFTEVYAKWQRTTPDGTKFDAIEWENKFQLTETGKYPIDIGLLTEVEITHEPSDPNEFKFGPLFQTEFGKLQLNGNLFFQRTFGGVLAEDEKRVTEISYQWQIKYRYQASFEFGAQGFGEMGEWNHWEPHNEQIHKLGPAIFGAIDLGNHRKIKYNAALLFSASDAAPRRTFRLQTEYEF
ncbi:MAG: hypothetical protein EPO06_03330 [Burkholderiaceae bacterium]|nr:MAG: hypothetical protein EPO06_03330 [Burkholderiaceae bacterium]